MTHAAETRKPTDAAAVRTRLEDALHLDLVGPRPGDAYAEEKLPGWERPSHRYLTGFLIPVATAPEAAADEDEDDEIDQVPENTGLPEESTDERKAAKKSYFPSSIGLSFLADKDTQSMRITVRWGDYEHEETFDGEGKELWVWNRTPRESVVTWSPIETGGSRILEVPDSGGLKIHALARRLAHPNFNGRIPVGTLSVSLFLVNERNPFEEKPDLAFVFQACMEAGCDKPFVPRPDPRGAQAREWDEQVADLHFADSPEYATGHGVSADWEIVDGQCKAVRTAWIPEAEVEKTVTVKRDKVETRMEILGEMTDGKAVEAALLEIIPQYRKWIQEQLEQAAGLSGERKETAEELLRLAGVASNRIEKGIRLLVEDADALEAFRLANRSVAKALRMRLKPKDPPEWRIFQLAFILLNLPGMARPQEADREIVDLLFFPTGGGKTEAYLGLAAFAMVMRRLRNPGQDALEGSGVCVIMRYTLRPIGTRGRTCLRIGVGADREPGALGKVAVRNRLMGGQGGHTQYLGV
jgi:hypothetical protein